MAADEVKGTKRKGATDSAPKPKKQKKSEGAAATKKTAKALKAAVEPIDAVSVNVRPTRKRTEIVVSVDAVPNGGPPKDKKPKKKSKAATEVNGVGKNDEDPLAEAVEPKSKSKKAKQSKAEPVVSAPVAELREHKPRKAKKAKETQDPEASVPGEEAGVVDEGEVSVPTAKKSKKSKGSKKLKEPEEEAAAPAEEVEQDEDADDQTAALLAGFESDRDESDLERDDTGLITDNVTPKISKAQRLKLEKAARNDEHGVVYLGRIPRGFFEKEMKSYFSQFGKIIHLRLSRNKKTGASKHFAFIEFASADVADIVAETMNNYLMFNHILQCKVIPPDQVHPDLFKGDKRRFTVDPRNQKAGAVMARGAERSVWEKRVNAETKRRSEKNKALKADFDYEFTAPALKAVEDVPMQDASVEDAPKQDSAVEDVSMQDSVVEDLATQQLLTEATGEVTDVVRASESTPSHISVTETVTVTKPKKGSKGKANQGTQVEVETVTEEVVVDAEAQTVKKTKKTKKRKAVAATEVPELQDVISDVVDAVDPVDAETLIKPKKTKKRKAVAATEVPELQDVISDVADAVEVVSKPKRAKRQAKTSAPAVDAAVEEVVSEKKQKAKPADQDGVKSKKTRKAKASA
ncbi:hypothetical protein BDV95DRAFT_570208 [Massariosphaeria phaeospora]|uniref:RRM domain-containing protein n=1 Tax=Massariosphaeria phaeospora TaxID=100035 RepID=A0A7C8MA28_9PLEO|nr:hypothetical protein BDV95DRAFT_570208 [Massariosphaeria phaeospora]